MKEIIKLENDEKVLTFPDNFLGALEHLTGKKPQPKLGRDLSEFNPFNGGQSIGHSQFNEILLMFGYDRINEDFFQFLVNKEIKYIPGSQLKNFDEFRVGVRRFQRVAALFLGNINRAYDKLRMDTLKLNDYLIETYKRDPLLFEKRHDQIITLNKIDPKETYYLGYKKVDELKKRIEDHNSGSEDDTLIEELKIYHRVVKAGKENFESYLISDHMDVYIATSMREKHEYMIINKFASKIFSDSELVNLNLRWFDPTQAYTVDRIDKGLSEALMLKRVLLTLYLAQESDTLGKDSELASTLAQGKPVIAFVPMIDEQYLNRLIAEYKEAYEESDERKILSKIILMTKPAKAWDDKDILDLIGGNSKLELLELRKKVLDILVDVYDKRANMLREIHPLGVQVNLDTGVANGVLVVRNETECIELIKSVVLNELILTPEYKEIEGKTYILLKESISKCVFRIITGYELLTSAFWNFYLTNQNKNKNINLIRSNEEKLNKEK